MKSLSLIPWLLAVALVALANLIEGGNLLWFVSPSALVVCYGTTFVLLLMQYSPADMARLWRTVAMKVTASRQELQVAQAFFDTMRRLLLASGFVGLAMGAVFVLAGIGTGSGEVRSEALAEGLAVSLIALLYAGFGILFVAIPGEGAALKKLALLEPAD